MLKIDAINYILTAVGEQSINSLATEDMTSDAAVAVSILDIQVRGLTNKRNQFNTDENVLLTRDAEGHIAVPPNILHIEIDGRRDHGLTIRNGVLYNTKAHSSVIDRTVFEKDVLCTAIVLLDFDNLPEHAQRLVMAHATRIFAERTLGIGDLSRSLMIEESLALEDFNEIEINARAENYLSDSLSFDSKNRFI